MKNQHFAYFIPLIVANFLFNSTLVLGVTKNNSSASQSKSSQANRSNVSSSLSNITSPTSAQADIDTPKASELILKQGDRIVWFGDSITAAMAYARYVEDFFLLRRPDLQMSYVNAGIGGHSAWNGLERIDRDVLAYQPNVVFINFGMNDAGYFDNSSHANFFPNMDSIIARLKAAGVRKIVWIDPSPIDLVGVAGGNKLYARQKNLEKYTYAMHQRPSDPDVIIINWQGPLKQTLKNLGAGSSLRLISDRIHPGPAGHAIMATQILRGIGADLSESMISSNYSAQELSSTFKVVGIAELPLKTVNSPMKNAVSATLDITSMLPPVPFPISIADRQLINNAEVNALGKFIWKIDGLDSVRKYTISIDGIFVGAYSGAELSRGVDLLKDQERRNKIFIEKLSTSEACNLSTEMVYFRNYDCISSMLYKKDQLRLATRTDKNVSFPDFMSDDFQSYQSLIQSWANKVDQSIVLKAREINSQLHLLKIESEN